MATLEEGHPPVRFLCPACGKEDGLVIFARVPVKLRTNYHQTPNPLVTPMNDALCVDCYWQGTVGEVLEKAKGWPGDAQMLLQVLWEQLAQVIRPWEER